MKDYVTLQKRMSRKYKDKEYHKWVVIIPEEDVKFAGLKEGDKLNVKSEHGQIRLNRRD